MSIVNSSKSDCEGLFGWPGRPFASWLVGVLAKRQRLADPGGCGTQFRLQAIKQSSLLSAVFTAMSSSERTRLTDGP